MENKELDQLILSHTCVTRLLQSAANYYRVRERFFEIDNSVLKPTPLSQACSRIGYFFFSKLVLLSKVVHRVLLKIKTFKQIVVDHFCSKICRKMRITINFQRCFEEDPLFRIEKFNEKTRNLLDEQTLNGSRTSPGYFTAFQRCISFARMLVWIFLEEKFPRNCLIRDN